MRNETKKVAPRPEERRGHHIRDLLPELEAAGTFEPASAYHAVWLCAVLVLYFGSFALLLQDFGWVARAAAIVLGAVSMMQVGLFAHEVGHGAVTARLRLRKALGLFTNSFLVGFSYTYWQSTHSLHHNHPNAEGVDPDMESLGYSLYERTARRSRGLARLVTRLQPTSVLLGFLAWAGGIKVDGMIHVARNLGRRTAVDAAAIVLHFVLWLVVPMAFVSPGAALLNYAAITVLNGLYMGAILVVPHVGTGTQSPDQRLSFFERQVRYSRNYDSSWLGTLLCGGLNLQIEHHLLPHVPCVRLRRARPIIAGYCEARGLPYEQASYWAAWRQVLSHLREMAAIAERAESVEGAGAPTGVDQGAADDTPPPASGRSARRADDAMPHVSRRAA